MLDWVNMQVDFSCQWAARLEAAAAAVAAEAVEVPRVGGVGRAGTVSLAPVLPVVLTVVPTSLLVLLRRSSVRARAGRPPSLPARQAGVVRVHLGLQEIQQRHGQLQVGALVAMHRVASPALVETVHQVSHPTVVFPRQEISREQKLGVPAVQSVRKLLVEGLQIVEQLPSPEKE
jgi:hypothetical protein